MKAEIIAVGTELLLGQIVNTNAQFLSQELAFLGVDVYFHTVVGDNKNRLKRVLEAAIERSDLIILTGGLGPTEDDLTKETVAEFLGIELEENELWKKQLESFFSALRRKMSYSNLKQTLIPQGGQLIFNDNGTAPGIYLHKKDTTFLLLPGPPKELKPMFRDKVVPLLKKNLDNQIISSRVLKVIGMGESIVGEKLSSFLKQNNPTVAPLAHNHEVSIRITAKGKTQGEVEKLLEETDSQITQMLGNYIYGKDSETLEKVIGDMLEKRGKTLAVAESCTGGYLSNLITNVPGSSNYFLGGLVTYSEKLKEDILKVEKGVLKKHSAVSEEATIAMALNTKKITGADYSLAITGFAGSGLQEKSEQEPAGLVYIALASEKKQICREFKFWGKREDIKARASIMALDMLRQTL